MNFKQELILNLIEQSDDPIIYSILILLKDTIKLIIISEIIKEFEEIHKDG